MQAHSSNSVILKNRTLWFDGDSTVDSKEIMAAIFRGKNIDSLFVEELTDEIKQYNKLVPPSQAILVKNEVRNLSFEWNIPENYKNLDVISYVADKLQQLEATQSNFSLRQERCAQELQLYKKMGLFDTLRVLIYIVNTLVKNDVVWGVGRGSSVSSYVLYVIGLHDVDSFEYDLNIEDFLRT